MSAKTRRVDSWTLTGRLVLGTMIAAALGFWWLTWSFEQSQLLSRKSPDFIFRMLFHQPVPGGVTRLKYAGYLWNELYMRAGVNDPDAFIKTLQASKSLSLEADPGEKIWSGRRDCNAEDVGWQGALAIRHPVIYDYRSVPDYPGWAGLIIIDKDTHTLYVQGSNM